MSIVNIRILLGFLVQAVSGEVDIHKCGKVLHRLAGRMLAKMHPKDEALDQAMLRKGQSITTSSCCGCSWGPSVAIMQRDPLLANWQSHQNSLRSHVACIASLGCAKSAALCVAAGAVPCSAAHTVHVVPRPSWATRITTIADATQGVSNSHGKESKNDFDLVVFQSSIARLVFKRMVSTFQSPDEQKGKWSERIRTVWSGFKEATEKDKKVMKGVVTPMLAMNGDIPCAAAFYSDAAMNEKNTFYLSGLIGNAGDTCRGGGAAILCHLIRNSNDIWGSFTPLKLNVPANEPLLKRYYEAFGCSSIAKGLFSLKKEEEMVCGDPDPKKCRHYIDKVFDADTYFKPRQKI
eukprot:gnl/MRDRNA2_/MRDRNA2_192242_c0_seq1.p1 gnl/MRDRNA2_/MRDRNA2_192242_c0~~gnl/MRDRNA2_/MRDRNA2_192242_c0_seq1.p1  ORF type:complete len:349 (+),score=61.37 gnl/MRDRNA2_/MRDRNA2_192242_c0_seq1:51-1097(+)